MRQTAALVLALLALTGCPSQESKSPATKSAKLKTAKSAAAKTSETAGPGTKTGAPSKTRVGDPPPAARKTPAKAPGETVRPTDPPTGPTAKGGVTIRPNTVLRPQRNLMIGLVQVRREPERVAWLAVGIGELSYRAMLRRGDRLYAGDGILRLEGLRPGGGVSLSWVRKIPAPSQPARIPPAPSGSPLRLPSMGLYALQDGRVIGVGNVRRSGGVGRAAATETTLMIYPKGYQRDPLKGYDLHEHVRTRARFKGKVARLRVTRVKLDTPTARGEVVLRIR